MWISNSRFAVNNIFTVAGLWGLWKLRNFICFQNGLWKDVPSLLHKVTLLIQNWKILCPQMKKQELELKLERLNCLVRQPGRLAM